MATAQLSRVLHQLRTIVGAKAYDNTSDRGLLERFLAEREEAAFVALLKRHGPMVLQVCRRVHRDEHDVEDVFQATFMLFARKADSIRKLDSVASWLHGVAHRLALEAKRKNTTRQTFEKQAAEMRSESEDSDPTKHELQAALDEALQQVPEKNRIPLLLRYLEGKTHEEAARQLGCPLGTIRSRLARGRDRLKTVLERQGVRLSATTLAASLTQNSASATVSPMLLIPTTRAAFSYVGGKAAAAAVSARVAALLEGGIKATFTIQLKIAAVVVIAAGALGLGAGAFGPSMFAGLAQAPVQKKPPQIPESKGTASGSAPRPQGEITVGGRVLDDGGKPLAGAKLFMLMPNKPEPLLAKDIAVDPVAVADAKGSFNLKISPPGYLVAYADGFGVNWVDLHEPKASDEIVLRLPKDVLITGRVVSTEGKPVAGVLVSPVAIFAPPDEKLDDFLRRCLRNFTETLAWCKKRLDAPFDGITGAASTDRDGRFTLRGAGAERILRITFSGGGIAQATPFVITRQGFDPKPYNDVFLKGEYQVLRSLDSFPGLYPPSLTFVAETGKTIEGIIKDAASGKPLVGCHVSAQAGWGDHVRAISDANGKYRLDGMPKKAGGYHLYVVPPKNMAYMNRIATAADTGGYTPVKLDIDLVKGAVVTGRVVDKQTGKGVQAGIQFAPLPDNRFLGSKPGFDNYRHDGSMQSNNKDGRFRLITIPGKVLINVQVHQGEKFNGQYLCPYRRADPDPDHKELFNYDKNYERWTITTAAGSGIVEDAAKVIDIKENEETNVELLVDRGVTARLTVQDADGQPLVGAWVAGLTDHWPITYKLPEPTATVYALNPEKPRTLVIFHPEKKLGGTVTIRGDEKAPVTMKLGPVGTVIARLLDTDGNPLAGAAVSINAPSEIARELYRFANPTGQPVTTDKDGRFMLPGVVPGISFYVQTRKGNSYFTGKPKIGLLKLEPGESLNLGDRTMELMR